MDQDARLDRNWQELLQELRVAQTGVQLLTGFLLTIPFTEQFEDLADSRRILYACIFTGAVLSSLLLLSPAALHRAVFHQGKRPWLVDTADRLARAGLACMAATVLGVVWFILDLVVGSAAATVVAVLLGLFVVGLWVIAPVRERRRRRS